MEFLFLYYNISSFCFGRVYLSLYLKKKSQEQAVSVLEFFSSEKKPLTF